MVQIIEDNKDFAVSALDLDSGVLPHPKDYQLRLIEFAKNQNSILLVDPGNGNSNIK